MNTNGHIGRPIFGSYSRPVFLTAACAASYTLRKCGLPVLGNLGLSIAIAGVAISKLLEWYDALKAFGESFSRGIAYYEKTGVLGWKETLQANIVNYTKINNERPFYTTCSNVAFHGRRADNGHQHAGAARDHVRECLQAASSATGVPVYELSPARQSNPDLGYLEAISAGDLHGDRRLDKMPPPGEWFVIRSIDCDYYISDPDLVFGRLVPAQLYSFDPLRVAGYDGEASFTIKENIVEYIVSGGGSWEHSVWNWSAPGEFLEFEYQEEPPLLFPRIPTVSRLLSAALRLNWRVVHKVVVMRPFKEFPHRAVVTLIPQSMFAYSNWLPKILKTRKLEHRKFTDDRCPNWNRLDYYDDGVLMTSVGRAGEIGTFELPRAHLDVLMALSSPTSVTSRLIGMGVHDQITLALIGQYYRKDDTELIVTPVVTSPAQDTPVHVPVTSYMEVPESKFRMISNPLIENPALLPGLKDIASHSLTLSVRVDKYRNNKVLNPQYQRFAREWIAMICPDEYAGTGIPISREECWELLDKPTQRAKLCLVWDTLDVRVRQLITSFIKNEPVMGCPRLVSAYQDIRYLLLLTCFTAVTSDLLHMDFNTHWYMVGRTPPEIAEAVVEYCGTVRLPCEGDFTKLDGSVSESIQVQVVFAFFYRFFKKEFHDELRPLLNMALSCPAIAMRFGYSYGAGPGIKSGNAATSQSGTIIGGFTQYCAVRRARPDFSPQDAFRSIGLCFGDDSVFNSDYRRSWNAVCKTIGLGIKCRDCPDYVVFLSRVFPKQGSTTSFYDPRRALVKMHYTGRNPQVSLADAAMDKFEGLLITDRLTPLIGNYVRRIRAIYGPEAHSLVERMKRQDKSQERAYWAQYPTTWPQAEEDLEAIAICMADMLGMTVDTLLSWCDQIDKITDPYAFPQIRSDGIGSPYKQTLDRDALPVEDVDLRSVEKENKLLIERIQDAAGAEVSRAVPASGQDAGSANSLPKRGDGGGDSGDDTASASGAGGEVSSSAQEASNTGKHPAGVAGPGGSSKTASSGKRGESRNRNSSTRKGSRGSGTSSSTTGVGGGNVRRGRPSSDPSHPSKGDGEPSGSRPASGRRRQRGRTRKLSAARSGGNSKNTKTSENSKNQKQYKKKNP